MTKRITHKSAGLLAATLCVLSTLFVAEPAYAACLSSSATRQAIASGQARPLGSMRVKGQILSAQLCEGRGGLIYVLSVLDKGQVREVRLDARTGQRR